MDYYEPVVMTPLAIQPIALQPGEWIDQDVQKDTIYLHHTAGGHRPDWTVQGWNVDRSKLGTRRRVATAYVIGGRSSINGSEEWDGVVVRCYPDNHWCHHLGVRSPARLEQRSIGIELCNYGYLDLSHDGRFFSYVRKPIPEDQVEELAQPFRGYLYYHRYTKPQLESLHSLLGELADRHNVDLRSGLCEWISREALELPSNLSVRSRQRWLNRHGFVGSDGQPLVEDGIRGPRMEWAESSVGRCAFEYNPQAYCGHPGVWTHSNVRSDKTDCSPQRDLIELVLSL